MADSGSGEGSSDRPKLKRPYATGARAALGGAGFAIFSSMFGFGALANESGFSFLLSVTTTVLMWALPGQVAFAELYAAGASAFVIFLAVALANARFLPMTIATLPVLRPDGRIRPRNFFYAYLMSITSWIQLMLAEDQLRREDIGSYYMGFALAAIATAVLGTGLGFIAAGTLPQQITLALLFLPPVYILLMVMAARRRTALLAVAAGALAVPPLELIMPDWGVVIGGLVGGTLAFLLSRALDRHAGRRRDG